MGTREWAYSMIDELTEEEFNALIVILKSMHKNSQEVKQQTDSLTSLKGIFHEVADPAKIPLEEGAWERAAVEKHLQILEDMKNENP